MASEECMKCHTIWHHDEYLSCPHCKNAKAKPPEQKRPLGSAAFAGSVTNYLRERDDNCGIILMAQPGLNYERLEARRLFAELQSVISKWDSE